jgi:DeoR family transcriptional regulator, aga operon transcriptional repressor
MDEDRKERRLKRERRRIILDRIAKEGRVLVCELAQELEITQATVRQDLNALAREGLLQRAHGGAFKRDAAIKETAEASEYAEARSAVAIHAASLVEEGQSIILDPGPIAAAIARLVKKVSNLTVITNALSIAFELIDAPGIEVVLTGGVVRRHSLSLVGHLTEQALDELAADVLFMEVDGIDPHFGHTTLNLLEARVHQQMMKIAGEVVVVADSSKFGKRSLALVCRPDEVGKIVTDSSVDPTYVRQMRSLGVEVKIV